MRTSEMFLQLKLQQPVSPVPSTRHAAAAWYHLPRGPGRLSKIRIPKRPSHRVRQLHVRHVPARARPRAQREGTEGPARPLDPLFRVPVRHDPALGSVGVRVRVEDLVVVDGVRTDADVGPGRDEVVVDGDAAGADLAPERAADGRGHAQGFVDAGAEVAAGGEFGPGSDLGGRGEGGADLGGEGGVRGGVGGEVEE